MEKNIKNLVSVNEVSNKNYDKLLGITRRCLVRNGGINMSPEKADYLLRNVCSTDGKDYAYVLIPSDGLSNSYMLASIFARRELKKEQLDSQIEGVLNNIELLLWDEVAMVCDRVEVAPLAIVNIAEGDYTVESLLSFDKDSTRVTRSYNSLEEIATECREIVLDHYADLHCSILPDIYATAFYIDELEGKMNGHVEIYRDHQESSIKEIIEALDKADYDSTILVSMGCAETGLSMHYNVCKTHLGNGFERFAIHGELAENPSDKTFEGSYHTTEEAVFIMLREARIILPARANK